ncbi:MAG: hypothetical protein WCI46_14365 [Verrucomicrobiota bacterium]
MISSEQTIGQTRTNTTNAGHGSDDICDGINASLSPSPDRQG